MKQNNPEQYFVQAHYQLCVYYQYPDFLKQCSLHLPACPETGVASPVQHNLKIDKGIKRIKLSKSNQESWTYLHKCLMNLIMICRVSKHIRKRKWLSAVTKHKPLNMVNIRTTHTWWSKLNIAACTIHAAFANPLTPLSNRREGGGLRSWLWTLI